MNSHLRIISRLHLVVTLVVALVVFLPLELSAELYGDVTISPKKPEVQQQLTITYTSGDLLRSEKNIHCCIYYFNIDQSYPVAYSYPMKKDDNTYSVTITSVPSDATFAIVKFGNGHRFDSNSNQYWSTMFYKNGTAVIGANMRKGFSFTGNTTPSLTQVTNLEAAKKYLHEELSLYPGNLHAAISLVSVQLDTKEITKEAFDNKIETLLAKPYDLTHHNTARAVSRAMRAVGRTDEADKIQKDYITKYPTSDFAEEVDRTACYNSQTREEFTSNVVAYIKKFRYGIYSDKMYIDLIQSYLQQGDGNTALQLVRTYPVPAGVSSNPPAGILNMVAVSMLSNDSLLSLAQQNAERAIRSAESFDQSTRPRFITPLEYEYSNTEIHGISYDTYGVILRRQNKLEDAVEAYTECEKILGDAVTGDMLEHQSEAFASSNKGNEALQVCRRAIAAGKALAPTIERFKLLTSAQGKKSDVELAQLLSQSKQAKKQQLRWELMNYDISSQTFSTSDGKQFSLNDFTLTSMDGKEVRFSDLKGKVVVIDFWATWCGPCKVSMPYMQKVYEKYKSNSDVQILMVNVWEKGADRKSIVSSFLKQNSSYSFPMFMDLKDMIVGCFGVTGIPTKFYIDKSGKVQFKEVGFPGADVFVEETSDKIDLLLSK